MPTVKAYFLLQSKSVHSAVSMKTKEKNKVADLTKFSECPENWSKSPMIQSKWLRIRHITDMGWKYSGNVYL